MLGIATMTGEISKEIPILLKRTAGNVGEIADLREKAVRAFIEKLLESEGDNLLKVVLFGSVARGDSSPDSDVDLFILLEKGTRRELRDRIADMATDVNLEEGDCKVYIAPFIKTLEEYNNRIATCLSVFINIDREGVVLHDIM